MNSKKNNDSEFGPEGSFNLFDEFRYYFYFWPFFIISILIFSFSSFIYLRYSTNIFESTATIQVKKKSSDISNFLIEDSQTFYGFERINTENDIAIIKSHKILKQVVNSLDLQTLVYNLGTIKDNLIYGDQVPFEVKFYDKNFTGIINIEVENNFYFLRVDDQVFEISEGKNFKNENFIFTPKKSLFDYNWKYSILRITKEQAFNQIFSALDVIPNDSDNITIKFLGVNIQRNNQILNKIIETVELDQIKDKQKIFKLSIDFIENRLSTISSKIDSLNIETTFFKSGNEFFVPEFQTGNALSIIDRIQDQSFETKIQIDLSKNLKNSLQSQSDFSLLPNNVGIENTSLNSLVSSYNNLVLERDALLSGLTEKNPIVKQLSTQLKDIKINILNSIDNYVSNLKTSLKNYDEFNNLKRSKIAEVPALETQLKSISRNYQIAENLYMFLLERKEDASISYIAALPNLKVIDYAYSDMNPKSPNKNRITILSILLGFFVPFGILNIIKITDRRIHSREDIEKNLNDPVILAEIPFSNDFNKKINDTKSIIAESTRLLRTNLNYLLLDNENTSKTILVTSTGKSEGKTFIAFNIAKSLSLIGKKTIIIGADLRNPQLHKLLSVDRKKINKGFSNLVVSENITFDDVIVKNDDFQMDYMLSGPIPPNPAEILDSKKVSQIFKELKSKYDYVIIDTAPIALVSDTIPIIKYADSCIYCIRAHKTNRRVFTYINDFIKKFDTTSIGFVLNGIKLSPHSYYRYGYSYDYAYNYKYNYGYSYGYGKEKE